MQELFRQIVHLEKKLHHPEQRKNRLFLNSIIHDEFLEFCRSGVSGDKASTLDDLLEIDPKSAVMIYSENFNTTLLKPGVILVTYRSYELAGEKKVKITNRSSIWIETRSTDWQLRFHQGTAAAIESSEN